MIENLTFLRFLYRTDIMQDVPKQIQRTVTQYKSEGSPYSITERRVPTRMITVLGSQPACEASHKPGDRLPLLSARPAVTSATPRTAYACCLRTMRAGSYVMCFIQHGEWVAR